MTVVEFIRARLDEDQGAAEAASHGGRWRYEDGDSVGAWTLYDEYWSVASMTTYDMESYDYRSHMPAFRSPSYIDPDANGRHIARHDPARVLAQVAAMRAIVDRHESTGRSLTAIEAMDDFNLNAHTVVKAVHDSTLTAVRHLATIWAAHDDYDPSWAPEGE